METETSSVSVSLEWTFLRCDVKRGGAPLESNVFTFGDIPNCKFYILVEYSQIMTDTFAITVRKSSKKRIEIDSMIVSQKDLPSLKSCLESTNWTTDQVFHFSSEMVSSTDITITCDMTWYWSLSLYNDMESFLLNPSLSDFTIVIDGEELPVHKLILGAQSSVFLAMFESDMKESKENKVTIEDVGLDVMKNVLSFLYTGSEEALSDSQMAMDMWIVAEKYNIVKLKDSCEIELYELIRESNVLEILEHAVHHELQHLRDACVKFYKSNKKNVTNEPNFKTSFFEKPEIMYTLFYDVAHGKNTEEKKSSVQEN